jgi:hypothetical protein
MKQALLRLRRAVALAVLGLLGACTNPTGAAEGLVVVRATAIERPLPAAAPVIAYRIENMSSRPVFILACGERLVAELEQRRRRKLLGTRRRGCSVPGDLAIPAGGRRSPPCWRG